MFNFKAFLPAALIACAPLAALADTCATLPNCDDLGFSFSDTECGNLKKLKCPFGDKYFCSKASCNTVSVNTYLEKCTKYCAEDSSKCIEKTTLSCEDAMKKLTGGRSYQIINDGAVLAGSYTSDLLLMGAVTSQPSVQFVASQSGINIYDVGDYIPACKEKMGGKKASLKLNQPKFNGRVTFNVATVIKGMIFSYNDSYFSADFHHDAKVDLYYETSANAYNASSIQLNFFSTYNNFTSHYSTWTPTNSDVKVHIECQVDNVNINSYEIRQYSCPVSVYVDRDVPNAEICVESSEMLCDPVTGESGWGNNSSCTDLGKIQCGDNEFGESTGTCKISGFSGTSCWMSTYDW